MQLTRMDLGLSHKRSVVVDDISFLKMITIDH